MVPFMEQKRAMGKLNSVSYNPPPPPPPPPPQPQINQESQVNLPLAPIISTPPDRRGNTAFSTHRGSAIFSTTQTLDQPKDLDPDPPQHHPPPQHDPPDGASIIRYVECLRNHAASVGRHVLDGCGEFMPNGEEGTLQALHCAACDCHRSFHRRETSNHYTYINPNPNPNSINNNNRNYNTPIGVQNNSSSEDVKVLRSNGSKKRFRTKFSQQQKDRMQEFATRLGWKMQKQDEQELQKFCSELGVKRQVYKVWMHNNKQAMKKRSQIM